MAAPPSRAAGRPVAPDLRPAPGPAAPPARRRPRAVGGPRRDGPPARHRPRTGPARHRDRRGRAGPAHHGRRAVRGRPVQRAAHPAQPRLLVGRGRGGRTPCPRTSCRRRASRPTPRRRPGPGPTATRPPPRGWPRPAPRSPRSPTSTACRWRTCSPPTRSGGCAGSRRPTCPRRASTRCSPSSAPGPWQRELTVAGAVRGAASGCATTRRERPGSRRPAAARAGRPGPRPRDRAPVTCSGVDAAPGWPHADTLDAIRMDAEHATHRRRDRVPGRARRRPVRSSATRAGRAGRTRPRHGRDRLRPGRAVPRAGVWAPSWSGWSSAWALARSRASARLSAEVLVGNEPSRAGAGAQRVHPGGPARRTCCCSCWSLTRRPCRDPVVTGE